MGEKNDKLYDQVAENLIARIRELLKQRTEIENQIDTLREALAGILKVSKTEVLDYILPDAPSSISAACEAILKYADRPLTAIDIRDALVRMNFAGISEYTNLLATIHTTLKRMEKKGWIIAKDKDGKTGYVWNDRQFAR